MVCESTYFAAAEQGSVNYHVGGNLREVAQASDVATIGALIDPVLERFQESLEEIAAFRPELEDRCAVLQKRLRRFVEPPREASESDTEFDDNNFLF